MYWWYALPAKELAALRQLLRPCWHSLNPRCSCSVHTSLRSSAEQLRGGVNAALDAEEQARFAWLALQNQDGQPWLTVDRLKGIGQTAPRHREP